LPKTQEGNIIRDVTIKVADQRDLEFVQGLESLGMNRSVARVITYLKDLNEKSSRDIEVATGLRQPEVSIVMQTLRERGWITEHEIKNTGKGRPVKIYALLTTIDEILNYCEAEKSREYARASEAIQRLKELRPCREITCTNPGFTLPGIATNKRLPLI
jgi:predicted transcriptional regulator